MQHHQRANRFVPLNYHFPPHRPFVVLSTSHPPLTHSLSIHISYSTCPDGAKCVDDEDDFRGSTLETMTTMKGYYRLSDRTAEVRGCEHDQACGSVLSTTLDREGLYALYTKLADDDSGVPTEWTEARLRTEISQIRARLHAHGSAIADDQAHDAATAVVSVATQSYCNENYEGPLCSACVPGFYRDMVSKTCEDCSSSSASTTPLVFGGAFLLAVLITVALSCGGAIQRYYKKREDLITRMRDQGTMLIITYQIIGGLGSVFEFSGGGEYPQPFQDIIGSLDMLNLNIFQILHLECSVESDHYDRLRWSTLIPVGIVSAVAAVRGIQVACWGASWLGNGGAFDGLGVKGALILIFFILPMVSTMICSSFACTKFNDGLDSYEFMTADLSIECERTVGGDTIVNPIYTEAVHFAIVMIFV